MGLGQQRLDEPRGSRVRVSAGRNSKRCAPCAAAGSRTLEAPGFAAEVLYPAGGDYADMM